MIVIDYRIGRGYSIATISPEHFESVLDVRESGGSIPMGIDMPLGLSKAMEEHRFM